MKKSDSLKHQLAESLQATNGKESPPQTEASSRSQKCSITLYQTDLDILDRIRVSVTPSAGSQKMLEMS